VTARTESPILDDAPAPAAALAAEVEVEVLPPAKKAKAAKAEPAQGGSFATTDDGDIFG
jgi:hypothetical protein